MKSMVDLTWEARGEALGRDEELAALKRLDDQAGSWSGMPPARRLRL
jgi:hypothetical protein